jgi:L-alanine-DL-glutamate epimerase-like enolase superfamily enzyme
VKTSLETGRFDAAALRIVSVSATADSVRRPTFTDARQSIDTDGNCQVEVVLANGARGSSTVGFARIDRAPYVLASMINEEVAPVLVGCDGRLVRGVRHTVERLLDYHGVEGLSAFAISAIDVALWDAIGRSLDVPVWQLVGPIRDRIPAYATVGWLNLSLEKLSVACKAASDAGFRGVKIKVGAPSLEEDLLRVRTARDAVGPDVVVMVDANQAFNRPEALRRGLAYQEAGCYWFEEPIAADDVDGLVELCHRLVIPVAAGENTYGRRALFGLIRRRAVDVIQPDLRRAGGFTACLEIGAAAAIDDIEYASHAAGAHIHALAAIQTASFVEIGLIQDDAPPPLVDGCVVLSEDAGFG